MVKIDSFFFDRENLKGKFMLIIVGKVPPPIGGVSIHVSRLLDSLALCDQLEAPYHFMELSKKSLILIFKKLPGVKVLHLHCSSPYVRLIFALICLIYRVKLIITYHGNLGRFNQLKNLIDYWSVRLCFIPIVLNDESMITAKSLNNRSILISAFIPPVQLNEDIELCKMVTAFCKHYKTVFCTNAFDLNYDKYGNDIYGITFLLTFFERNNDVGLVFSDPSGNYSQYLEERGYSFPSNVLVIPQPHSFVSIIKRTNCLLRTTTTDGDSISVKEALFYQKDVIASDCVSRPKLVRTYKKRDFDSFNKLMMEYIERGFEFDKEYMIENGFVKIAKLYQKTLS